MVLHLLDQLDSLLTRMQGELPRNPDTRPLPPGWVEHFDPQRSVWYYINLDDVQPRATFVHPIDESTNQRQQSSSAQSFSSCRSVTLSPSRSHSRPSTKSHSAPTGSAVMISPCPTTAQQLYASSLGFGSKSTRSLRSVSASHTASNFDPENISHSLVLPATPQTSTAASAGPVSPAHLISHDPKNFFDCARLSQGTRKYRLDQTSPTSSGSQSLSASTPSIEQSSSPNHPTTPDLQPHRSTNTNHAHTSTISAPMPPDAQALYNPSIVSSKPPPLPRRRSILPIRRNCSISLPLTAGVSKNVNTDPDPKRPQPIHLIHRPSDTHRLYTATTEDESLKVAPIPHSTPFSPATSGVTEDNLLVLPSHPTPTSSVHQGTTHLSPTPIDVRNVQNPEPPAIKPKGEKYLFRANSVPHLHIRKNKSIQVGNTLVLQQPRPIRPLSGLPAHLNIQLSGLDSSKDARYYAENFQGKGKERKSYGFSAIFEAIDKFTRRDSGVIVNENT